MGACVFTRESRVVSAFLCRHACSLFQQRVPPLLAFNRGTVGFLTPFHPSRFKETLRQVIQGGAPVHKRRRLAVTVSTASGTYGASHVCSRMHACRS